MRTYKDKIKSEDELYKVVYFIRTNFQVDSLRLRASFIWITENIAYDIKAAISENPLAGQLKYVLRNKKAICGGYAALLKYFCDGFNIESEIVEGYGRTGKKSIVLTNNNLGINHAWNAVKINGTWRLLDATWASGSSDEFDVKKPAFHKKFDETYYFTSPEKLILNHLPSKNQFQFMDKKMDKKRFKNSPLFLSDFLTDNISDVSPDNARIKTKIGDTVTFKFKTDKKIYNMFAFSEKLEIPVYQGSVNYQDGWIEFRYPVGANGVYNLYIGYIENFVEKRTLVGYKLEVN